MKNLIDEIIEILNSSELSEVQKLKNINELCNEETNNYEDLLDLRMWVMQDIVAGNFDIQQSTVHTEGYERVCKLEKEVIYTSELEV